MSRCLSLCHQHCASGRLVKTQEWLKEETRRSNPEKHEADLIRELQLASCVRKAEGLGCPLSDVDSALAALNNLTELKEVVKEKETDAIIARAQTCLALMTIHSFQHSSERSTRGTETEQHQSSQNERKTNSSEQRYQLLREASEMKDMFATFHLAVCFDVGCGVKKDKNTALQLYHQASAMGHPKAMVNLGVFLEGQGPKRDQKTAFELFQRAADLGDDDAVTNLGICFARGFGTDKNTRKAIELFRQAQDMGNYHAITRLGLRYLKGDGFHKDVARGLEMIGKGAEKGDGMALFHLGACYFRGDDVVQDQQKGLMLLQKASEQGTPEALLFLGTCLKQGHFFACDQTKADTLFQQIEENAITRFGLYSITGRATSKTRTGFFEYLLSKLVENEEEYTFCIWRPTHHSHSSHF